MSIQAAINSMIGSASRAVMSVKGYQALKAKQQAQAQKTLQAKGTTASAVSSQELAAQQAKQSAQDAINAKKLQRRSFKDYLAKYPTSLGPAGKLPENVQKQIAKQFSPSQRQRIMNKMDEEASNGKHK